MNAIAAHVPGINWNSKIRLQCHELKGTFWSLSEEVVGIGVSSYTFGRVRSG